MGTLAQEDGAAEPKGAMHFCLPETGNASQTPIIWAFLPVILNTWWGSTPLSGKFNKYFSCQDAGSEFIDSTGSSGLQGETRTGQLICYEHSCYW